MNKKELAEYIENKIEKDILENTILFYGEEKDLFKEDILKFAEKILCLDLFSLDKNKAVNDLKISNNFWVKEKDEKVKQIKISEVKNFFEDAKFKALKGKKVYILDDADLLNINSQNAILKIIEEPNKGTYIFLLASQIDSILNTIKSRCTKIYLKESKNFTKIDENIFNKKLEEKNILKCKDIFLDALELNRLKYLDRYNKIIDKNNIDIIIENLEEIYEYSFQKNLKTSSAYYILLDIKKKKSYNLNLNILKYELIFGIYNTLNLKEEKITVNSQYMKTKDDYLKKNLNNLDKIIYS